MPVKPARTLKRAQSNAKIFRLLCLLADCWLMGIMAYGAQASTNVTLAWNPSADTKLAGYRVYNGVASHTYTNITQVGNVTNATVSGLAAGVTYFFAVTAFDSLGLESAFSSEISYTVPNSAPPAISLTAPVNGTGYQAPATINCAATVTPNGHVITKVQFYNSSTLLAEVAAAPYTYSWNNVSAGNYSLTAKAVYDAGSTVSSSSVGVTVTNATTTTTNLVGYWTFDTAQVSGTTAIDSSGAGNGGTLQGTPLPPITPGKVGQAVILTNISQSVSVADSATLNLRGPFTVASWVNFSALPGPGKYPNVVAKLSSPAGYYGYGMFWNGSGVAGIIGPGSSTWYTTSPYVPTAGVWNHYVTVFDGTNLRLYVNGTQYSQVAATAPGSTATIPIKMGPHYSNPSAYGVINGMLDDVRIYGRALSATEVTQLYSGAGSGCTYAISPTVNSFNSSGGVGSVNVTAAAGCSWTASSGATWIAITAGGSGSGNGTVAYSVAGNTTTSSRTGTMAIAGQTFTITQNGLCSYAVSPASASFAASGGTGSATVTASAGCVWVSTSGASWISVNSGSAGTGNGNVTYSVGANTAAMQRTGTLTIAGQTLMVSQAAAPTDTTPPVVSLTAPANGSTLSGSVSLNASASDNVGVTKVEFYCDGAVLVGTATVAPYSVLCDTRTMPNGSHSFYAKAYDAAGNSTTSVTSLVTVRNHKK